MANIQFYAIVFLNKIDHKREKDGVGKIREKYDFCSFRLEQPPAQ